MDTSLIFVVVLRSNAFDWYEFGIISKAKNEEMNMYRISNPAVLEPIYLISIT